MRPAGLSRRRDVRFHLGPPALLAQKLYAVDERDLSRAPTLDVFLRRYGQFIRNCTRVLKTGGKLAVLMGDYRDREPGSSRWSTTPSV